MQCQELKEALKHAKDVKIVLKWPKYYGAKSKLFRTATEAVDKALVYAYRDRRAKKRSFRALWIARINAATRSLGLTYSRFMEGLKRSNISLDRKILAEMAASDAKGFGQIVEKIQVNGPSPRPS